MIREDALLNRRILITREDTSAKRMAEQVKAYGGIPVMAPVLSFEKVQTEKEHLLKAFEADWVVLTSGNGVRFFLEALSDYELDQERLTSLAVVGKKTERILKENGLQAKLVPETFSAKGLARAFESLPTGQRIVLVKGRLAKETLQNELEKQGHTIMPLILYDTVPNISARTTLNHVLREGNLDVLTFTSPSSLDFFLKLSGLKPNEALFEQTCIACIGPETRQAAIERGLKTIIMPDRYTADALIDAIANAFSNHP
ncbi:MAG TPA: uroporphyrinogen-III synthase [Sporolactobacillaceae bacterium]|nr:uroporphyrinogen-III synthase [Sporolactobacillaceae bacterium]